VTATPAGVLERFLGNVAADPDRVAIAAEDRTVTYAELADGAQRAARWLIELGLAPGARVAWLGTSRIEFFELLLGTAWIGTAMVPLNWRLSARELAQVVTDAEPHVIVADEGLAPDVEPVVAAIPSCRLRIVDDRPFAWTDDDVSPVAPHGAAASDAMWLSYTSGTTGQPKGVVVTHGNFLAMFDGLSEAWRFLPGRVTYMPYPIFHGAGILWVLGPLLTQGTAILRRAFDPPDLAVACRRYGVTNMMMVPAVLQRVLEHPGVDREAIQTLQTIVYGVSPISESVLERALEALPATELIHAYGLTEATGAVTVMPWADHRRGTERMRSCGRPYDFVELRVVDPESMVDVPVRTVGEVVVRGDVVTPGYFRRPAETADAIVDGWLRTGDAGYLDEDGFLYLTDRVKDMIITGGENVYPAEVENVLFGHPLVREAAVFGAPDPDWGERVVAAVALHGAVTAEELIAYCRQRLAHYKCPRVVEVVDELPRNPTGKVLRRQLREPYWAGHDRRIG